MILKRPRWFPEQLLALVFVVSGCASGPPPGPSPEQIAGQNAKTILVAPFNIVSSLPTELESSTKLVREALVEHLEAHGKTVRPIGFRIGRDLWRASMKEVRDSGQPLKFENAANIYARRLGEIVEFDVLIVPSIFVQNAKSRLGWATWDDVKQKVEITGNPRKSGTMAFGSLYFKAASIFVHILDRNGDAIQSSRVGLELLQHVDFPEIDEFFVVNDVPPMENKEAIRAGIAKAISPFLPEEVPLPATRNLEASPQAEEVDAADPS